MKRFLILLSLLFCTTSFAATETINWYIDNDIYTTTTCQTGENINLPNTPVKKGHTFQGWKEFFNRGTFANFYAVPQDTSLYAEDYTGNHIPENNDYITIDNANDYIQNMGQITFTNNTSYNKAKITFTYFDSFTGTTTTRTISFDIQGWYSPKRTVNDPVEFNGRVIFYVTAGGNNVDIKATEPLMINGNIIPVGSTRTIISSYAATGTSGNIYFSPSDDFLSGKWKFVYQGNWAQDGKNGWKPLQQIN